MTHETLLNTCVSLRFDMFDVLHLCVCSHLCICVPGLVHVRDKDPFISMKMTRPCVWQWVVYMCYKNVFIYVT